MIHNYKKSGSIKDIMVCFDQKSIGKIPNKLKYKFCQLIVCTLRKYFYKNCTDNTRYFSLKLLNELVKSCNFNKSVLIEFRNQLCDYEYLISLNEAIENLKCQFSEYNYDEYFIVICRIFVTYLENGIYDSRFRTLIRKILFFLSIDFEIFEECEDYLSSLLSVQNYIETEDQKKVRLQNERTKNIKRWALIGATGLIGGTLIGLTGGLAAPLIASGVGTILGTSLTAGLATTAGATILGIGFGVAGAGLTGYKMKTRIGNIEQFKFIPISNKKSLHTLITVTGWIITKDEDKEFLKPWENLRVSKEEYTLIYEKDHLLNLGQSFKILFKKLTSAAVEKVLKKTILAGILEAVAWPMTLLAIADIIDNPWSVCMSRSEEVGELLCDVLIKRVHGQKPVSLIGFSIGARVIFYCLLKMAQMDNNEGIIENVILLGAPVTASPEQWGKISKVVSGTITNGYSTNDWILRFLYRTINVQFSIAGISSIDATSCQKKKIINHDLSKIVNGHLEYRYKIDDIMNELGVKIDKEHYLQTENYEITKESNNSSIP